MVQSIRQDKTRQDNFYIFTTKKGFRCFKATPSCVTTRKERCFCPFHARKWVVLIFVRWMRSYMHLPHNTNLWRIYQPRAC